MGLLVIFSKYTIQICKRSWGRAAVGNVSDCGADRYLTADPGVASLIRAWFHTFVEIDREIISMAILLPSADSRRAVASYKRKYVLEELINCFVKLVQEKSVVS